MSDFKIGSKVILVNSGMEGTVIDINMNHPFPYKVETPIGGIFAGEYAMKLKRLNDATPAEHDAVNYYKKLDERLPDDFWDGEPDLSVVKDDSWDERRADAIAQNGNDGLHYGQITANNTAMNNISKPKHYMLFDFEALDLIYDVLSKDEFKGYCIGNALKYRLRAGKKGDALEDLAKASEYEKIWERYYGAY